MPFYYVCPTWLLMFFGKAKRFLGHQPKLTSHITHHHIKAHKLGTAVTRCWEIGLRSCSPTFCCWCGFDRFNSFITGQTEKDTICDRMVPASSLLIPFNAGWSLGPFHLGFRFDISAWHVPESFAHRRFVLWKLAANVEHIHLFVCFSRCLVPRPSQSTVSQSEKYSIRIIRTENVVGKNKKCVRAVESGD